MSKTPIQKLAGIDTTEVALRANEALSDLLENVSGLHVVRFDRAAEEYQLAVHAAEIRERLARDWWPKYQAEIAREQAKKVRV